MPDSLRFVRGTQLTQQHSIVYREPRSNAEFEALHRLNHCTFADELGQHEHQSNGFLIDKFHAKNKYFIAISDNEVIGMIATHHEPPYSISDKFPTFESVFCGRLVGEVRLLAVHPRFRQTTVFCGLVGTVARYLHSVPVDLIAISGVRERREMYHRLGFQDLGAPVRCGSSEFFPMIAEAKKLVDRLSRLMDRYNPTQ